MKTALKFVASLMLASACLSGVSIEARSGIKLFDKKASDSFYSEVLIDVPDVTISRDMLANIVHAKDELNKKEMGDSYYPLNMLAIGTVVKEYEIVKLNKEANYGDSALLGKNCEWVSNYEQSLTGDSVDLDYFKHPNAVLLKHGDLSKVKTYVLEKLSPERVKLLGLELNPNDRYAKVLTGMHIQYEGVSLGDAYYGDLEYLISGLPYNLGID